MKYFGNSPWHFMDDNCPFHRSKETEDWKLRNNIPPFFWPPQCPDLNPFENVWLVLKYHVKHQIFYICTINDLKQKLLCAWNNLSKTYLLFSIVFRKRFRKIDCIQEFITKYNVKIQKE